MSIEHDRSRSDRGKLQNSKKKRVPLLVVGHSSHMYWSGVEHDPPWCTFCLRMLNGFLAYGSRPMSCR